MLRVEITDKEMAALRRFFYARRSNGQSFAGVEQVYQVDDFANLPERMWLSAETIQEDN